MENLESMCLKAKSEAGWLDQEIKYQRDCVKVLRKEDPRYRFSTRKTGKLSNAEKKENITQLLTLGLKYNTDLPEFDRNAGVASLSALKTAYKDVNIELKDPGQIIRKRSLKMYQIDDCAAFYFYTDKAEDFWLGKIRQIIPRKECGSCKAAIEHSEDSYGDIDDSDICFKVKFHKELETHSQYAYEKSARNTHVLQEQLITNKVVLTSLFGNDDVLHLSKADATSIDAKMRVLPLHVSHIENKSGV